MRTHTLDIPACTSLDDAARLMIAAVVDGRGDVVIAEFNSIWLEARRGTTERMITDQWDAAKLDEASVHERDEREKARRLALYPALLSNLKRLYDDHPRLDAEVADLIARCENPTEE